MYDINIGKRFYLGSETSSDPRWWGGEPVRSSFIILSMLGLIVLDPFYKLLFSSLL
jgi:hypothetical protein